MIHGERFATALKAKIEAPELRALPATIGSLSQCVDSTDRLTSPTLCHRLAEAMFGNP